jgi:Flp pilus assembly protein TadD
MARGGSESPALAEARKLRRAGHKAKALALLDQTAAGSAADVVTTRERGLLALELGDLEKARTLLKASIESGPADWRVHSALGAALAQAGQQQAAQLEFARALELAPDHPVVLNNLALSYALDGRHEQAENLLRRATQSGKAPPPHARQNLALLLALKGKTEESRKVAEQVLPPSQARANASYLASLGPAGASGQQDGTKAEAQRQLRSAEARPAGDMAPIYRLGGPAE